MATKTQVRATVCLFCLKNIKEITFRDTEALRHFTSGQNKILPRKKTGTCSKHQRIVSREIKRAREMGMLGYRGQWGKVG
jgi:small subunit ribosomal protein S18